MSRSYIFSSESVSEGHPDKVADQISDAILDAILKQDPSSRVACETLVTTGLALIAGEITTKATIEYADIVRDTIRGIGYTHADIGFDADSCSVQVCVGKQSPDIAMGVDSSEDKEQGAGDQGLMFGYACTESPELMPLPIIVSHQLVKNLADLRKNGQLDYLRPDAKSQVSVLYENGKPVQVDTVVISTQHAPDVTQEQIKKDVTDVIMRTIDPKMINASALKIHVNPTGQFIVGGPKGDCGLTGRKIIVDTYGGAAQHGGGAFSGKDPSKVDRSAAYMGRYVAKNLVAAGVAERLQIQVAYAIGVAQPVSIMVEDFGTGKVSPLKVEEIVREVFDFSPAGIEKTLDLRRPIYQKTAAYGHFGRELPEFSWEATDKADEIRKKAGL